MGGRIRVPSSRALDNAANRLESNPSAKNKNGNDKPKVKRGRPFSKPQPVAVAVKDIEDDSMLNGDDEVDEEEEEEEDEEDDDEREPDSTLYCVCLGIDTGEQPMIQCENCSNWFHFTCIGLNETLAAEIEAYCCDTCEEMGLGQTRKLTDKKQKGKQVTKPLKQKPTRPPPPPPPPPQQSDSDVMSEDSFSGTDSDEEEEEGDQAGTQKVDDDEDDLESDLVVKSSKRGKKSESDEGGERKRRRRKKVQVDSEEDQEYVGDEEGTSSRRGSRGQGSSNSRRRRQSSVIESPPPTKPRPRKSNSNSTTATSTSNTIISVPATDKVRAHCIKTLASLFVSIFAASNNDAEAVEEKSSSYAESVEGVLFEALGEVDLTSNIKGARTKYTTKLRSLVYNLKSNSSFRSRITSSELSPSQIANMTNEDLLTPELKAMAESVRAASLKHSVKEVIGVPTAKLTHKGEVAIENHAAGVAAEEERVMAEKEALARARVARERSNSIISRNSPSAPSPIIPDSYAFGPPSNEDATNAITQSIGSPTSYSSTSRPRNSFPLNLSNLAEDINFDFDQPQVSTSTSQSNYTSTPINSNNASSPPSSQMLPPKLPTSQTRSRNSFDMASVWGNVKANEVESNDMETEGDDTEKEVEDEFDPFAIASKGGNDEDFEASLLRDENSPLPPAKVVLTPEPIPESDSITINTIPKSTTPPLPEVPVTIPLSELPPVWAGDLIVPDEGGFPAFAVQVGGRPLGTSYEIWKQILPKGLTMSGRIKTQAANKHLVDCSFAPSRELLVLVLLPDLTGPNEFLPNKPKEEKCLIKFNHVIEFYTKKDRIGVISAPENLKKKVKDIYIIPLKQFDPMPEYLELMDNHNVPEGDARDRDILLAVLVVQKGSFPTLVNRPSPTLPILPPVVAALPIPPREVVPTPLTTSSSLPLNRSYSQNESLPYLASTSSAPYPSYSNPSIQQSSYAYSQPPLTSAPTPFDASTLQSILAANPSALSSLLSNPSLLQSVMNSSSSSTSSRTQPQLTVPMERLDEVLAGLSSTSFPPPTLPLPLPLPLPSSSSSSTSATTPYERINPYVHPSRLGLVEPSQQLPQQPQLARPQPQSQYQYQLPSNNNNNNNINENTNTPYIHPSRIGQVEMTTTTRHSSPPPPPVQNQNQTSTPYIHPSRMNLVNNNNDSSSFSSSSTTTTNNNSMPYVHPSRQALVGSTPTGSSNSGNDREHDDSRGRGGNGDPRRGGNGGDPRRGRGGGRGGGGRGGMESGSGWGSRGGRSNNDDDERGNRGGY